MKVATPWIYSKKFDSLAIIGPPVFVTLVVLVFGQQIAAVEDAPLWLWVLLVLGIDVAHVYSSLFRTYFDKEEFQRRRTLYTIAPIMSWVSGVLLYAFGGPGMFWGVVTYFAIYHFVRQQYGFFMLYRRGEPVGGFGYRLDQVTIYLTTIYPLVYWHTYPRNFQWFSNFEILQIPSMFPELICRCIYISALILFSAKEARRWAKTGEFNLGKVTLLFATAAAWSTGIILFNGNVTFMLINIVSHGVPYIALIWIYQYRKKANIANSSNGFLRFFQLKYVPLYVLALVALATFEEGIWDWLVWKEHGELFGNVSWTLPTAALIILVPLLTMPQVTHYVLDAFIWRVNKKGKEIRAVIG